MLTSSVTNPWISCPQPRPMPRLRLFCFPYAGGGASIFRGWPDGLPMDIEICAVQLPGRENRLLERPFTRLAPLIQALSLILRPYLDLPFAFFGHSMGALISFELARLLRSQCNLRPAHLFVSAYRAPHLPQRNRPLHRLPAPEFVEEIRRLNGTPHEVLRNEELMELLLPLLRADFALCETYAYVAGHPLDCPLTVFGGHDDDIVSDSDLRAWDVLTSRSLTLQMFPGNHFFLQSSQASLLRALSLDLAEGGAASTRPASPRADRR